MTMTTKERLEDDEYRDSVKDEIERLQNLSIPELYEKKRADDQCTQDAAKLVMNRRDGDSVRRQ